MKKLKKLFGEYPMTWPKVILMAVLTAAYTALVNLLPLFRDTSFQDIAVYLECWLLFAVFIIVNCKKCVEAMLKCFVFFLISQPLIYLLEVPFLPIGWGVFQYYPYWGAVTLLTLPGAAIAFQLKRKNLLSVLVLSVATVFLAYSGVNYLKSAIWDFPHHLLSAVFCLLLAVFFIFTLLEDKKHRVTALAIFLAALLASVWITGLLRSGKTTLSPGEGEWSCTVDDTDIVSVEMTAPDVAVVSPKRNGSTMITFTDGSGAQRECYITVSGGSLWFDWMASSD